MAITAMSSALLFAAAAAVALAGYRRHVCLCMPLLKFLGL